MFNIGTYKYHILIIILVLEIIILVSPLYWERIKVIDRKHIISYNHNAFIAGLVHSGFSLLFPISAKWYIKILCPLFAFPSLELSWVELRCYNIYSSIYLNKFRLGNPRKTLLQIPTLIPCRMFIYSSISLSH